MLALQNPPIPPTTTFRDMKDGDIAVIQSGQHFGTVIQRRDLVEYQSVLFVALGQTEENDWDTENNIVVRILQPGEGLVIQ